MPTSSRQLDRGRMESGIWHWALAALLLSVFQTPLRAAEPAWTWQPTAARPYVLRGADRRLLDRADRFLKDQQWDDALRVLMQLIESKNPSVTKQSDQSYVSLQAHCHRLISQLPPEPLARYRSLVDTTAKSWYQQGIAERDTMLLQRVVDHYFCSSWGDKALHALGDLALQRGDYQKARTAWQHLGSHSTLVYPDSNLLPATVHARLALVAIREGDWRSATAAIKQLQADFPKAAGRLGGRDVVYADHLTKLLAQAKQWPPQPNSTEWRTFAGNSRRDGALSARAKTSSWQQVWSKPIANKHLSIFPIAVNDLVVYQDQTAVHALKLSDGSRVFRIEGEIFQSPEIPTEWHGRPKHTLSATNRYVYGATTSPLGPYFASKITKKQSTLWSLDLERDGAVELHLQSQDQSVAFAGAPIVDGTRVFVPIRSNNQTARMGVACYDLDANEWSWQQWLCQADTPATGRTHEIANVLLTLDSGFLYANTNLGAIAALRADDGQVQWLRTYKRQLASNNPADSLAYYRGANPAVYIYGVVYVLPVDSSSLLALDAGSGTLLWQYPVTDPWSQLYGVTEDQIVVSNNGLQVLDRHNGSLIEERANEIFSLGIPHETEQANLLWADDKLLVASPSELVLYQNQPDEKTLSKHSHDSLEK